MSSFCTHDKKKSILCLSLLFLLALAVRWGAWYSDPGISRDGILYVEMAESMAEFSPGVYYQEHPLVWEPPLYPQMISWGIRLGLPAEPCAVAVNLLFGAGSVLLLFLTVRRLSPESKLAWYTALAALFSPELLHLSAECQREMSYFFFLTLFCYGAVRYWQNSDLWAILCAASATLGYCSRVEALELFLFFPLIVLGKFFVMRKTSIPGGGEKNFLQAAGVPLLLFFASALLWIVLECLIFQIPVTFVQRQLFRWSCRIAGWF